MLPRKRHTGIIAFILTALVTRTEQYGSGAPPSACTDQKPIHPGVQELLEPHPYQIVTSASQVRQNDVISVTITSNIGGPNGFLLQARKIQDGTTFGTFTKHPVEITKRISCVNENDTVTHTSPNSKPALTFEWKAPTNYLGAFEFRATVAQGYDRYWLGLLSPLLEVVTPDTQVSTRPTTPMPALPERPPVIMESKPKQEARVDPIYRGCEDNKLCFGAPQNCIAKQNCKAVVAVLVEGDSYTFEIQGIDSPKYVAAALSMDSKMGDDSAMECVQNNGRINLYSSWTYPKTEPYVSRIDSPQDILQLLESSFVDGKLYCKFRRQALSVVKGINFDLITNQFNLMIVAGSSMKNANRVGFHDIVYEVTESPLSLASVGQASGSSKLLLKLHGSFMIVAWLGTSSIGIVLARYFRQTWVGRQLGGKDIWFAYHRILMVLTWLLSTAGFVIILVQVGGWAGTGDNPHAITGVITVVLCFIQPIGAYFRPHPGTKKRPVFNWLHWLGGNTAHILGIATIFLAVYLQKAELPTWTVYILAAFVVFHVIMHLLLTLTACISDGRISNGRVNSFPMRDMIGHSRQVTQVEHGQDAPYSSFRRIMLWIYEPVIVLFVVAVVCLVALAPIQATYDDVTNAISRN